MSAPGSLPAPPASSSSPAKHSLRRLLGFRGIHWIATRFGGSKLRGLSFDEKFKRGDWDFQKESPELVALVEKYCGGGHILMLGCGQAPIAGSLAPDSFASFLGVDLSQEAITTAQRRRSDKCQFEIGDMMNHQCRRRYDVILFSDSIYYAPRFSRKRLLKRLEESLTSRGRFVVTIAHPDRYANILKMIRRNFKVELDRPLSEGKRHVIVFA